jgi:hypothetical protein
LREQVPEILEIVGNTIEKWMWIWDALHDELGPPLRTWREIEEHLLLHNLNKFGRTFTSETDNKFERKVFDQLMASSQISYTMSLTACKVLATAAVFLNPHGVLVTFVTEKTNAHFHFQQHEKMYMRQTKFSKPIGVEFSVPTLEPVDDI